MTFFLRCFCFITLFTGTLTAQATSSEYSGKTPLAYLEAVALPEKGIGAREAGSEKERKTAQFIQDSFEQMGLDVSIHAFKHAQLNNKDSFITSSNVIAEIKGDSDKVIVLGAHYDSTAKTLGSHGAVDNGSGIAVLLSVAEQLSTIKTLPYTVRFLAFGAEEIGLVGVNKYVSKLNEQPGEIEKILGMINLDTVAGGDVLYIHSAHSTPYRRCADKARYSFDTMMRDALLAASKDSFDETAHQIHPPFPGFPAGETGGWSDHAPFACSGIPVAQLEATNFSINGKDGFDGYSQTTNPALWDCFDTATMTACDREKETKWGHIWHKEFDQLPFLQTQFPGRLEQQLNANTKVLVNFFRNPDKYFAN
ncbi:Zn-dependent exopeptidase M28 [Alteromonas sediminis]|uniref:Zn-dependent exopeptidase M28 n=1 Tax=Alteromonas sediminis TaxID=2259342 RepID=A0A3N5Z9M1_9ALTE|nr:M20/M25/M40 family metallo-hydrolase [Alteromonas sediminis]RPJ66008.1 Zn-dependent exopeptidase M28 [Alteromonas sediminis]